MLIISNFTLLAHKVTVTNFDSKSFKDEGFQMHQNV